MNFVQILLIRFFPFLFLMAAMRAEGVEKRILVIAHRGSPAYLPEHTLQGAAMAHAFGADFIEPDVIMTKDDELIVVHDIHLEFISDVAQKYPTRKRTDGRWYAVDFTLAEIKTLNAHERTEEKGGAIVPVFDKRFPVNVGHFQIPTLVEMIDLVRGLNISRGKSTGLYIELKNPSFHLSEGKDVTKKLTELLERNNVPSANLPVYIQCFDSRILKSIRAQGKIKAPLIQLIAENSWKETDLDYTKMLTADGIKEIAGYADGIGPYINQLVSLDAKTGKPMPNDVVKLAHQNKLLVHPYTVRKDGLPKVLKNVDELHGLLFKTLAVDGVFTDFSDLTIEYLRTHPI
jgi:glycerophosphoryl diester phosphodiesterase